MRYLRLLLFCGLLALTACLHPTGLALTGDNPDLAVVVEPDDLAVATDDLGPAPCTTCGKSCRSDNECGTGIICLAPGESTECARVIVDGGAAAACTRDEDCPTGYICGVPACWTEVVSKRCMPPCQQDTDCPLKSSCYKGHCVVQASFCGNCPAPYFDCHAPCACDTVECFSQRCMSDGTCVPDGGACVKGTCYASPGTCTAPF